MKYPWSKTVIPIAAIFAFRMLGLFMLIPVFTIFADKLSGATPTLIGIALGCYGLTQGILQMPFGLLSDKYGRKRMIIIGLILFALGSLIGALTDSIYGMIFARILQGSGAIGSVLIALLADLTPNEERTKAMAVIGMTIGLSFSIAMVVSPSISEAYGLAGIFYVTTAMAISGIFLVYKIIPTPNHEPFHADNETKLSLLKPVILDKNLLRLDAGIFFQHAILTSTFFILPLLLKQHENLHQSWHFYLPLMIGSFLLMLPFMFFAERKKQVKLLFSIAVIAITLTQLLLAFHSSNWLLFCGLIFIYFIAFNFLEATLPSLVSKLALSHTKGTAMGVYSSCQFLGIFVGGSLAGIFFQHFGPLSIFYLNTLFAMVWISLALTMKLTKN